MKDVLEAVLIVVGVTLLISLLFAVIAVALTPFLWIDCRIAADIMETNYEYNILSGCFFQTADGSYIHRDLYRGVEILE